ncbi:hypothetical protein OF83DRAFT_1173958 [Amylostereum chailletii]|nr:hypothetical protein OF83DRAFT_1173958 [Amylostereum chailletii]
MPSGGSLLVPQTSDESELAMMDSDLHSVLVDCGNTPTVGPTSPVTARDLQSVYRADKQGLLNRITPRPQLHIPGLAFWVVADHPEGGIFHNSRSTFSITAHLTMSLRLRSATRAHDPARPAVHARNSPAVRALIQLSEEDCQRTLALTKRNAELHAHVRRLKGDIKALEAAYKAESEAVQRYQKLHDAERNEARRLRRQMNSAQSELVRKKEERMELERLLSIYQAEEQVLKTEEDEEPI